MGSKTGWGFRRHVYDVLRVLLAIGLCPSPIS
jgi:hypothetical protein